MKQRGPGPDGARGYIAEQGLRAVIGGENVNKMNRGEERLTPEQMRAYLMEAPTEKDVSYGDEARRFAKALLLEAERDMASFREDSMEFSLKVDRKGDYDLTGFMAGWAINSVRYVIGAPPVPNPALFTL